MNKLLLDAGADFDDIYAQIVVVPITTVGGQAHEFRMELCRSAWGQSVWRGRALRKGLAVASGAL